ncbi:hypothetical protein ABIA33_005370 [Streptacidiphilus sp. MAP12-16]|uniref:SCO2583/SCO2584 N-terminal domain-containing protein n=1 Tax=Streptacidiphilus sp. MAP12-16 TaxID=3156300 RepID=UPI003514C247
MGGRAEPPEGAPEGGSGGEDEFRSVVFDESFVRAARIQELSARERMTAGTRPIRRRGLRAGGLPRQALALMLLIALAFSAAVYLGTKHPYPQAGGSAAELSITVIPLQPGAAGIPTGAVPSASVGSSPAGSPATGSGTPSASASTGASGSAGASSSASPSASASVSPGSFSGSPLQDYPVGTAGLLLPNPGHTAHFSREQVLQALTMVQKYLEASSLNADVLMGGQADSVRGLLAPGQYGQFDQSLSAPEDDRRHEATGWLVRFNPKQVRLAPGQQIRALGKITYRELDSGALELVSDHTFVYALTPAAPTQAPGSSAAGSPAPGSPAAGSLTSGSASATPQAGASTAAAAPQQPVVLFSVRREIRYLITPADLGAGRLELSDSVVQAGPMACDGDVSRFLQPIFPQPAAAPATSVKPSTGSRTGAAAASPAPVPGPSIDPFDRTRPAWAVCGVLSGPTL